MTGTMEWQGRTGDSWAEEWKRTDRSFAGLTEKLLAKTREFAFENVLDVGCGAGELSLAIARGRPGVTVMGVDISPQLVAVAEERATNRTNLSFALGDASQWRPPEGFTPDFLVSRHGVMFFDNATAAFANLAQIAAPGAGMVFSCFRGPAENEIFSGLSAILPPPASPPDPEAPGPMAFANPERIRTVLSAGGWGDIEIEKFDFAMVAGMGADPVTDAVEYFRKIGAAAAAMADMDEGQQAEILERIRTWLEPKAIGDIVALGAGAWIVSAKRA